MAENLSNSCEPQEEWMLVEMGESGLIAVEESKVEKVTNLDGTGLMKTYCICDGTTKDLFENLPKMMSRRPKAILLVLPNGQTLETKTDTKDLPGFTSQVKSTAKGGLDLAERTKELLVKAGIKSVRQETSCKGVEQGTRTISSSYISDIPVCQLAVQSKKNANFHYNLGRALAPLKHEDVLILGLCNSVGLTNRPPDISAKAFDNWLNDHLLNNRLEEIIQLENKIPHAGNVQSLVERLYPLLVALGVAGEGAIAERVHNGWSFCSHSGDAI